MDNIILTLEGRIKTDFWGVNKLYLFYAECSRFTNCIIYIDMYRLEWIDANLSSLFNAILHKLRAENNLYFSTDLNFLLRNFDILFRNGLFITEKEIYDERESTVALKSFIKDQDADFIDYVQNDLLEHRGMPNFPRSVKEGILNELIEIQCNIHEHSKTDYPFFVCGQYYPRNGSLNFSIVDLGVGFLPAIKRKTKSLVQTNYNAIQWALQRGTTTKINVPGGLGLYNLKKYCENNNSIMHIITGDTFWSSEYDNSLITHRTFNAPIGGTIINLLFSY